VILLPVHATSPTDPTTLALHDALPICLHSRGKECQPQLLPSPGSPSRASARSYAIKSGSHWSPDPGATHIDRLTGMNDELAHQRSEEHTSELQSPDHLVCRLLLEKKQK